MDRVQRPSQSRLSVAYSQSKGEKLLILFGMAALAMGVLVYMSDRPGGSVYLLPRALSFAQDHHRWFGAFGGYLPEFAHVCGFIMLTAAVGRWQRRLLPVCAFWWGVDSLLEIGQHPSIAPHIAASLPTWFQSLPIVNNTAIYFLHGTFDLWDLLSIAMGSTTAALIAHLIRRKEASYD